jgi:hypothetical protein
VDGWAVLILVPEFDDMEPASGCKGRSMISGSFIDAVKVTMFVIQMKNALRGLSAPAAWQIPEKFFI